jgi:hypothetical protein
MLKLSKARPLGVCLLLMARSPAGHRSLIVFTALVKPGVRCCGGGRACVIEGLCRLIEGLCRLIEGLCSVPFAASSLDAAG